MTSASRVALRLVKKLEKQGAEVTRTGSGHYKVVNPETGDFAFMTSTPGKKPQHDTLKRMRSLGYDV